MGTYQDILGFFMVIGGVAVGAIVAGFLISAATIHKNYRLRARPTCEPTKPENLPITFREQFGQLIRELKDLGFEPAANVTIHEPLASQQTTQCLLLNRSAGVRAIIYCLIIGKKYMSSVYMISEFSDGTKIRTTRSRQTSLVPEEPKTHALVLPSATPMTDWYSQHLAFVAQHAVNRLDFVQPDPGKEIEFLTARHAAARAKIYPRRGMLLDDTGDYYRPNWPRSFRMALAQLPLAKKVYAMRARRKRAKANA
jgi:hypothetical protein